jgi:hypothetical protein
LPFPFCAFVSVSFHAVGLATFAFAAGPVRLHDGAADGGVHGQLALTARRARQHRADGTELGAGETLTAQFGEAAVLLCWRRLARERETGSGFGYLDDLEDLVVVDGERLDDRLRRVVTVTVVR